jgi:excisionase family DNA binding protein
MANRPEKQMAALFVRLPVAQAEKLDRAAFELKVPKQELVNALVERYVDPRSPWALADLPGLRAVGTDDRRRIVVESETDALTVGSHSFRPHGPPEVLSPSEVADLLQVDEPSVRELAEKGDLPARKIAGEWRFARRAVLEWLGVPAEDGEED